MIEPQYSLSTRVIDPETVPMSMLGPISATVKEAPDLVDRVRTLAPVMAHFRDVGERQRHMPTPLFEQLRDAGFFALTTPRAVGGLDFDHATLMSVIEELARHDGSVGWNVMIAATQGRSAAYLPANGLRDVYARGQSTVIAGSLLAKGLATPVEGGFYLTGRWTLASGCHQADWMLAPGVIMNNGKPRTRADGRPEMRAFYVLAGACEILDTWSTTGLRGTGSHDFRVAEMFVPEARSFPLVVGGPAEPGALHMQHFTAYARCNLAAVALGIARDAIDTFKQLATVKTATLATGTVASQHTTHERVGRAEALVRAARAFLWETVRELPTSRDWSAEINDDLKARIRLASAHAAQSASEAVDLMFTSGGTTSIYTTSRLDRCFRDVHMVTQHVGVAPSNIEMVGQYLLGLGLQERR